MCSELSEMARTLIKFCFSPYDDVDDDDDSSFLAIDVFSIFRIGLSEVRALPGWRCRRAARQT
jgi:hypothetical protein